MHSGYVYVLSYNQALVFCYLCCSGKVPYFIYLFKYASYNFTHREIKNNSIKPKNQLGSAKKKFISLSGSHQLGLSALGFTPLRATSMTDKNEQVYMRMMKRSIFKIFTLPKYCPGCLLPEYICSWQFLNFNTKFMLLMHLVR